MKSRDALIRLKRFDVEEKRRKVADIEAMIGDFNHMAVDLDRQIAIEQERCRGLRRQPLRLSDLRQGGAPATQQFGGFGLGPRGQARGRPRGLR